MSEFQTTSLRAMSDNFVHVLHDNSAAIVVDPSSAEPVAQFLSDHDLELTHILITHHHADHTAGCADLKTQFDCTVIGPDDGRAACVDTSDTASLPIDCIPLATPGHTSSHLSFHFPDQAIVFTGDALFLGGCGRLFEGTPMQMWQSLLKLRGLPEETEIYPGHDYTVDNLEFCKSVLPGNQCISERLLGIRATETPEHAPLTIEVMTNVFLMCDDADFTARTGMKGFPGDIFGELRSRKDGW